MSSGGVLGMVGSKLYYCGPLGAGQVVKLANNLASCGNMAVLAEAYALATAGGARLDVLTEVMPMTSADSWQLRHTLNGKILKGDFSPLFKLKLVKHHHDVDNAFLGWADVWLDPGFRHWSIESCLPDVRAPILAIQGTDDEYGTMRQVDHIASEVDGSCDKLVMHGCGHAPHRDFSRGPSQCLRNDFEVR